ncbi:MAG: electron transfer flavoprotein subunit beta/FixA family protein, partial [Chloroflexi bacterium]|nr:electron transfer flavoprotein subunit beta/FixA family protein [Chloroflexota bacterium]
MNIIVCVKQVLDPEMPASAFTVDPDSKRVVESQGTPPVLNGFDENAVEAALRIKDAVGAHVTAL